MSSLVVEALRLLRTLSARVRRPDDLARRMMAPDAAHLAAADGGLWAYPLYRRAAEAALRVHAAATSGDEHPGR